MESRGEPSAHAPWTRTIFVPFVDILCVPCGCINVLFSGLVKAESGVDEKPAIIALVCNFHLPNAS